MRSQGAVATGRRSTRQSRVPAVADMHDAALRHDQSERTAVTQRDELRAGDLNAFDRSDQRRRKRDAVLRVAAAAFGREGFSNTSMDDVAAVLNVSKATLYQYFRSKQEILYECHVISMQHGEAGLALARKHEGSGLEKLEIYLRRYMQGAFGELGNLAVLSDVNSLTPERRAKVVKRRSEISHATDMLFRKGIRDGSIIECDPKIAKLFAMGVVNWIPVWFRADGEYSAEHIIDAFLDLFCKGLVPRPRPHPLSLEPE